MPPCALTLWVDRHDDVGRLCRLNGFGGHEFLVTFRGPVGIAEAAGVWGGLVLVILIIVLPVWRLPRR